MNLAPTVLWKMKAKHLIGCVSIRLEDNLARAYYTHQYIRQLPRHQLINVAAKPSFEPSHPKFSFPQDERIPKLFQVYLSMNGKLSTQAYHDQSFNCLDYFILVDINEAMKQVLFKKKIMR